MQMPNRGYTASANYRYGFNGKENDNEVKGAGNELDYGMRIYDPRLGRFLSADPVEKSFPWYTPYQFAGNKPIWAVDLDGLEELMKTSVSIQEASTNNIKRIFSEDQVRSQIAGKIYEQINKNVKSKQENHFSTGNRYPEERAIIIDAIKDNIKVDLSNNYAAIQDPDTKEPSLFYSIVKGAGKFIGEEGQPFVTQAAGVTLAKTGTLIEKVTKNVDSYKKSFYKKFSSSRYEEALKIDTKANGLLGKFLKNTGSLLKAGAKVLEVAGTAQMYYEILNPSPGPMSDDELRQSALQALKAYLQNSTGSNRQLASDVPKTETKEKN